MAKSKFLMPTQYLSFTQWNLWLSSKEEYKQRYFLGIKQKPNKYLEFGKKVDEAIETGRTDDASLKAISIMIPRYTVMQAILTPDYKGLTLYGKLDTFNPLTTAFRDYKTSKNRWTQGQADSNQQMTFYALLVFLIHKQLPAAIHIDWIETKEENGEMKVTGKTQEFETKRSMVDLAKVSKSVIQVAEEISEHYKKFVNSLK